MHVLMWVWVAVSATRHSLFLVCCVCGRSRLKDFQDGNAHSVEIEYNAQTMMLSIIVDERLTPQLTCNVDFKLALGTVQQRG